MCASFAKDDFDLIHAIETKAKFSHAIVVMDRIGGWKEGGCTRHMGGCQISGKHVDLYQSRCVSRPQKYAGLHGQQNELDDRNSQLGVCRYS